MKTLICFGFVAELTFVLEMLASPLAHASEVLPTDVRTAEYIGVELSNAFVRVNAPKVEQLVPSLIQLWEANPEACANILMEVRGGFPIIANSIEPQARQASREFLLAVINIRPTINLMENYQSIYHYASVLYAAQASLFRTTLFSGVTNAWVHLQLAEYAGSVRSLMVPLTNSETYLVTSLYDKYLVSKANGSDREALARFMKDHCPVDQFTQDTFNWLEKAPQTPLPDLRMRKLITRTQMLQSDLKNLNSRVIEGGLVPLWSTLPSGTPEEIAFKEKLAMTAKLVPEERKKIGLKE